MYILLGLECVDGSAGVEAAATRSKVVWENAKIPLTGRVCPSIDGWKVRYALALSSGRRRRRRRMAYRSKILAGLEEGPLRPFPGEFVDCVGGRGV